MIPPSARILLVREPVSGRFGMHKLLAQISHDKYNLNWNGKDEIAVVTFNKKRTVCKVLIVDDYGVTCVSRMLNTGKFQIVFTENGIPLNLTKESFRRLFLTGEKI